MPQSGNTKRKKRNQKKQQLSTTSVDESNASTSNLEKNQKDESGEGVSDRKVLADEFDEGHVDLSQDEQKSSNVRKKKKKKKKKRKRKEDVNDNPSTCKKSDSSDSCDEITENAEQLDTLEENKKLGREGIVESPVTNDEVSEILSVHEDSPDSPVEDELQSEISSCDNDEKVTNINKKKEEVHKDDEEDNHVNDELSCATNLSVEKTSITKKGTDSSITATHCEDITSEVNETRESSPDIVEIPSEGLSLDIISSDDEPPEIVEERNFVCLARLLLRVGAHYLRQYFKSIHPNWSNLPTDASALKKGVLKLKGQDEKQKFYSGKIEKWDVSLLIRVLRFSVVSSVEFIKHPDKDDALCKIQDIRNKLFAHAEDIKISETDFNLYWSQLKASLITIGAEEEEIESTLTDCTHLASKQYRHLLLEELHSSHKFSESKPKEDEKGNERKNENIVTLPQEPASPTWDTWLKLRDHMNAFQSSQTHYILLADSMTPTDLQNFKVLSAIPWKMVLDFNPSSEDDGLYKEFNSQSSLQRILSPFTPGEIKKVALPKQIDAKRTQWLFVNGRKEDADDSKPKSFPEWEIESVKHISSFFYCCSQSEKFDNQKSISCLLLPISEYSKPFADVTLKRFAENFSEFDISFACIDDSYNKISLFKHVLQKFPLSSERLKDGIEGTFNVSDDPEKYRMPTNQAEVFFSFSTREYAYMNESLELFYAGCEREAINLDAEEEDLGREKEENRKSFLSGNFISTASLYFNHDAKREIENDIQVHMIRLLSQAIKSSVIVRIAHSPGTGGSTIARRVLWNLHKSFPCACVKLPEESEFDEDAHFIRELCNRISDLEEKCGIPAFVLLDGHRHWRIRDLSNKIVRTLTSRGKKAVILECQHVSKYPGPAAHSNSPVHKVFYVKARLEDSASDLQEFNMKFPALHVHRPACRVFHFPLLSMMEDFRDRLEGIVSNTLDELSNVERDIAALVAFLQLYAAQSTPALLLYEAFESHLEVNRPGSQVTYNSIKNCFSDTLLNLMVYENRKMNEGKCFDRYTLQHRVVATLVFEKYLRDKKQSLYKYVDEFLDFGILSIETFRALYCDLFLFNKERKEEKLRLRFSILIEKLKILNPKEAAMVLLKAAAIILDPRVYGHAARFQAKMNPPDFKKAKDLVAAGLELSQSKGRTKSINDSKGVVLSIELKHKIRQKEVRKIEELEELAEKAITAFKLARDFPPSFPSPLVGEVEVWLSCIYWITNNLCSDDKEEATKYLTTQAPPFFRTCIGDCFNLLHIADNIISSSTLLANADDCQEHAHRVRTNLITAIKPNPSYRSGPLREIDNLCLVFFSSKTLAAASRKEVKRFRAWSLMTLYWREPQYFKADDLKYLVKLLEEMVLIEKDFFFARYFLQLCPQISSLRGNYSLEQGWEVCREWLQAPVCHDPMRYYFSMVIAFMQILNGLGPRGYFAEYKDVLKKLKDASLHHCKRNASFHYLAKNGDGMSKLINHASLFSWEKYEPDDSKSVQRFWEVQSRQKLKECTGRLRVKFQGKRELTTIELLEGNIELHVPKCVYIGVPGRDFDKDAKVYFVVSFNLAGPVANGITLHPVEASTEAVH